MRKSDVLFAVKNLSRVLARLEAMRGGNVPDDGSMEELDQASADTLSALQAVRRLLSGATGKGEG